MSGKIIAGLGVLSLGLGISTYTMKLQRDNARLATAEYQAQVESAAKAQEMRVSIMREQSKRAEAEREASYAESVKKMQGKIDEIKKKYSDVLGDNRRLVDVNSGLFDAANSTRRALSEMVKSSRASSRRGGDCNIQLENKTRELEAMTLACTQTTIDYDELRLWAKDNCEIYGCE